MFDKTAIEKLQELVSGQQPIETDIPTAIVTGSNEIASLERYMQHPSLFKSKFSTQHVSEFINYSKGNKGTDTTTYIDTDRSSAVSIFDHGTPEHPEWGHHQAQLDLKKTPAYKALLDNNSSYLAQLQLVDFLSDWEEQAVIYDENEAIIPFKEAINRIRRVKITASTTAELEQGDFQSQKSAMEAIEISSGQDKLPASFLFTARPYDDFEPCEFICQLRAHPNDGNIKISFRIIALEQKKLEIGNELKAIITNGMESEQKVYLGIVDHR